MKTVVVKFVDFWKGFDCQENIFVSTLAAKYDIVVGDESNMNPDLLIYSCFGAEHFKYNCLKLYYTGENNVPDFNQCDYALSFHNIKFGTRHMRFPLYVTYPQYDAIKYGSYDTATAHLRCFCSVVVSNSIYSSPTRIHIIDAINAYKPLASGGRYRNNVGGPVADKMKFISNYKFNLALENCYVEGYTTEKIVEAMAAHTVPIYWGSRDVCHDFNPASFINIADYASIDNAVAEIKRLDNDSDAYTAMLTAPKLNQDNAVDWNERLDCFLANIIENGQKYTHSFGIMGMINLENKKKEAFFANPFLRKLVSASLKLRHR